eukprot:224833-Rhodomonas_salina.3
MRSTIGSALPSNRRPLPPRVPEALSAPDIAERMRGRRREGCTARLNAIACTRCTGIAVNCV